MYVCMYVCRVAFTKSCTNSQHQHRHQHPCSSAPSLAVGYHRTEAHPSLNKAALARFVEIGTRAHKHLPSTRSTLDCRKKDIPSSAAWVSLSVAAHAAPCMARVISRGALAYRSVRCTWPSRVLGMLCGSGRVVRSLT
ncbi:hypothetical protein P171DRAFT_14100 [Karstenula rhodostoma CBS 690.94]|uniref:Uncharacterized protein n=1 Tax=Karstenula rhodostoma CBS 690.94 TaxID=1392251 RepID=A0A9P4PYX0_9PLEO|nr:hypothetical protein P171DRAFT_14100 [Karstenula rhodostoma CBS 690.94]